MTPKFLKFLIGLGLVNTVLFTAANLASIAYWWVLLVEIVLWVGYLMVRAWCDPAQQLVNQGTHMGWMFAATVRDENGLRDTLLRRDDVVVRVSFQQKALYIVEPYADGPYYDFLELEHALTASTEHSSAGSRS